MAHDVFISYSFDDQPDADEVVNRLTNQYGISCWICTRDIAKGTKYKRKIAEAIEQSQLVVLIQSKNAVESDEIPKEISIALDEEKKVIPFKIDGAKLKNELRYDLAGVEYIDATVPTKEQRIYELAKSICDDLGKPMPNESGKVRKASVLKSGKMTCSEIFAGRDSLMEEIHEAFEDRNVVFLHGMGGIGKSELARQYWKKHKESYDTVVFARYDGDLAALIADDKVFCIDGAARKTKEGNVPQSDAEYARDKLQILNTATDARTLIILDNFDIAVKEDPFFETFVSEGEFRVLVTTRCEPDAKKYHVIHVGEIDDVTLKSLFIAYANPSKTIIEEDDPDFAELFRLTNRHTYTLELVAKCMEEDDELDYLSEMIDHLKEHGFSDLHADGYDNICKLFRFTALNDTEKYFLRCLAMMPAGGVSQKLFKKWIGHAFSVRSRLVDLSLVKINGETRTISLHPVVREVIINELKPSYGSCRDFVDRCAMIGEDAIPLMWSLPYEEKAARLDCYSSLVQFLKEVTDETYPVFVNISYLYNYIAEYSQAIALQERIYRYVCDRHGAESVEAMLICNRIAWKNSNSHLFQKAKHYYQMAADWFYANPCYTTRESQDAIGSCAEVFYYLYRDTKDVSYLQKAYAYMDRAVAYGTDMIAATQDATPEFKRYLKFQVDCLCRGYLRLYLAEEKFDLAEEALEKFKAAIEEFVGGDIAGNADMASYYHHLGQVCYLKGNYPEARNAFAQSYSIYLRFFSNRNPRMIEIVEILARCCAACGDYGKAREYLATAVENARNVFTKDHPVLLQLLAYQKELDR